MTNRPHRFQKTLPKSGATAAPAQVASLSLDQLTYYANGWLVDCEIRQHSPATRATRRLILDKLLWHLRRSGSQACGTSELRLFFSYLINGHKEDGGRWGNPQMSRPIRPRTVDTYHGHLRTFFQWTLTQGALTVSPMALISGPVCRADQIQPFTPDQVEAILAACRQTQQPRRDEAMIMLLVDTGVRASELCGLKHQDLDLTEKRITVLGKGGKKRTIYFGQRSTKALWTYLGGKPVDPDAPLFPSERASAKGNHLSRYGLRDMIGRLEEKAGITGVRCSAHTFRHSFAISFLRGGGQVYALKEIMGHTDLKMTLKYVALAEADLASQRRFSPGDQLTGSG
ncbi:MAG: tyrosine-type recombinase/integrase, partial [Janthinobacterium lividum]